MRGLFLDVNAVAELPVLIAQELPGNLFDVLLSCQTYEQPWRAMLAHAFALERNLLAILAGCQQVCLPQFMLLIYLLLSICCLDCRMRKCWIVFVCGSV